MTCKQKTHLDYAELLTCSNFSFLRGASHPEELVLKANALGYRALAITDLHTLAGIVRAHLAAKEKTHPPFTFLTGCRINLSSPTVEQSDLLEESPPLSLALYPLNRSSYSSLSRLITLGRQRAIQGKCLLTLADFLPYQNLCIH